MYTGSKAMLRMIKNLRFIRNGKPLEISVGIEGSEEFCYKREENRERCEEHLWSWRSFSGKSRTLNQAVSMEGELKRTFIRDWGSEQIKRDSYSFLLGSWALELLTENKLLVKKMVKPFQHLLSIFEVNNQNFWLHNLLTEKTSLGFIWAWTYKKKKAKSSSKLLKL